MKLSVFGRFGEPKKLTKSVETIEKRVKKECSI